MKYSKRRRLEGSKKSSEDLVPPLSSSKAQLTPLSASASKKVSCKGSNRKAELGYLPAELEGMPHKQMQTLAKKHGIKANKPTKEIKAALTELYFLKFSGGVSKLDGSLLTAKQKQAMQELASNAARDIAQA
eukprot:g59316.t1